MAAITYVGSTELASGVTLPVGYASHGIHGFTNGSGLGIGNSAASTGDLADYSGFEAGTGAIGAVIGVSNGNGISGISKAYFHSQGGIGNISAAANAGSYPLAIYDAIFTTLGNIGNISITCNAGLDEFLAGVDAGDQDSYQLNRASYTASSSIGSVTVTGLFVQADLIASAAIVGNNTTFGGRGDVTDGAGSIGVVKLDTAGTFNQTIYPWGTKYDANTIEAHTVGPVTAGVAGTSVRTSGGGSDLSFNAVNYTAVRAI